MMGDGSLMLLPTPGHTPGSKSPGPPDSKCLDPDGRRPDNMGVELDLADALLDEVVTPETTTIRS
jgi:hypothetical protein